MQVGVPREIKNREYRVALTPAGAQHLVAPGTRCSSRPAPATGSAISRRATTRAAGRAHRADGRRRVGAPSWSARSRSRSPRSTGTCATDLTLFTYLHLAADRPATDALLAAGTTSIAYETVQLRRRLAAAARADERGRRAPRHAGRRVPPDAQRGRPRACSSAACPGVDAAKVVVLGGGVVGPHAAQIAVGMRADVTVLDLSLPRLRELDDLFGGRVRTIASIAWAIEREVLDADLVVGAVLRARRARAASGDRRARRRACRQGSVLVDVAVDQGGCIEDTRPTTHDDPTFRVHGSRAATASPTCPAPSR